MKIITPKAIRAEFIILDEPTSAMDSWAEADWLMRFRQLVAGRTSLTITHRFTKALQVDVIHVMERGRIVESGSHEELLAIRGRYESSWTRQMRGKGVGKKLEPLDRDLLIRVQFVQIELSLEEYP